VERPSTVLLTRRDVAALLTLDECIDAVEAAFARSARGQALPSGVLGVPARDGGFHVKAAGLQLERLYVAVKVNANFPGNPQRRGLPTIQGVIVLGDGETGVPLAVMDSIEITAIRTAAATAVAAKYLARADAAVATVCGCGAQGSYQLRALARVRPLRRAWAVDADGARAAAFARELTAALGIPVDVASDRPAAMRESDAVITCTPARQAYVHRDDVAPGSFVAAVGADSHDKQELHPELFVGTTIVVDSLEQCATIGDLHHALDAGVVTRGDVHGELADIVAGTKPGRRRDDEIVVFDSTGVALEDVAAAALVYEKAVRLGAGTAVAFGS